MGMRQLRLRKRQPLVMVMLLLLLVGLGLAPATAQGSPTVGAIVVDSFDCETGVLNFHVPVENVPHVPEGTSGFDYPLFYSYTAYYTAGSEYFPTRAMVWSPPADQDPYSGDVYLSLNVPTTNVSGAEPGTGVLTSIDLYVGVGEGPNAYAQPTDTSETTYVVDCETEPEPEPPAAPGYQQLVAQLVALLIAILTGLLGPN